VTPPDLRLPSRPRSSRSYLFPGGVEEIINEVIHKVKIIIVMDMQSRKEYSDSKNMKSVIGCFIVNN